MVVRVEFGLSRLPGGTLQVISGDGGLAERLGPLTALL